MIDGNDGGVDLSWDGGESWYTPPLPLGQFYHVTADRSVPYQVSGAMQDLGTASCPSNSLTAGGIANGDCHDVGGGESWKAISPDLTRNDKSKQKWSGGPITGDNTGVEWYDTIFAVAESPKEKGLIWVGSDDGLVHVTRNGGSDWTNVTPNIKGIPEWGTGSVIEPSPFDAATAYVTVDAHRLDDTHPYIWKTTDYGKTWKSLAAKLPPDVYLHAVREDPKHRGLLYLGTERGVSFSRDDGATWQILGLNLPTVAVHDLVVKDDDLVLATHGRSMWILDDLTPIRDWSGQIAGSAAYLFPARPAIRWEYRSSFHGDGPGENPPHGALINYALKKKIDGEITMEIVDSGGAVVRKLSSKKEEADFAEDDPDAPGHPPEKAALSTEAGVRRAVWDLDYDGATVIRKAKTEGNPKAAPRAVPGTYMVRLTVDGKTLTTPLEVRPDPRLAVPLPEIGEQ